VQGLWQVVRSLAAEISQEPASLLGGVPESGLSGPEGKGAGARRKGKVAEGNLNGNGHRPENHQPLAQAEKGVIMARKRRARSEGSVYYRKSDRRWVASVTIGYDDNGRQKRRVVYGQTQAEALEKKKELEGRLAKGQLPAADRLTLGHYLQKIWLPTIKSTVQPLTFAPYELQVNKHIVPHIGGVQMAKFMPLHVQQFYGTLAEAGVSATMRRKVGTTLGTALAYAVLPLRLIPFNPCQGVKKPLPEEEEFQVFDPEQVARFLEVAKDDRHYAYYAFALDSGAGPGECFALEWPDVRFDTGMVSIIHSLEDHGGHLRVKGPKRQTRKRHIRLSAHTLEVLHEHRRQALANGFASAPVFHDTRGGHLRNGNVTKRSFKPLLEKAGMPALRLYDLRHTCATLLLLAGVPAKVVSERLGHASVTITLDTYSHILPDMQERAADALHKVFTKIWSPELVQGQTGASEPQTG
jgi:integrase